MLGIAHRPDKEEKPIADEGDVLSTRTAADVLDWSLVDTAEHGLDALAEVLTQWRQDSHHRLLTYVREAAAGPAGAARAGFTSAEEVAQACAATTASARLWLRAHEAGRSGSALRDLQGNPVLAVPMTAQATTQSGRLAEAFDAWLASELRRAGFSPDEVWPRLTQPRVISAEMAQVERAIAALIDSSTRSRPSGATPGSPAGQGSGPPSGVRGVCPPPARATSSVA